MDNEEKEEGRFHSNYMYKKERYDRFNLYLPKGTREKINLYAKRLGITANAFITRAVQEKIEWAEYNIF